MDVGGLVGLLIDLVVLAIIVGFAIYLINWVNPPPPWQLPIKAIVALILFLYVLAMFGGGVPAPSHYFLRH